MPMLPLGDPPYIKQESSIREEHLSPSIKKKKNPLSPMYFVTFF